MRLFKAFLIFNVILIFNRTMPRFNYTSLPYGQLSFMNVAMSAMSVVTFFIHRKENENLTIGNPRVGVLIKLFFKALKVWVIQFFP